MQNLSVSIVIYRQSIFELEECLNILISQIESLVVQGKLEASDIFIVQNDFDESIHEWLVEFLKRRDLMPQVRITRLAGHGNVGFGRGHNLAIEKGVGDAHLIMNADVRLSNEVLGSCLNQLELDSSISLVAPTGYDESGHCLYLAKRYPSLIVLFSRMFPVFMGVSSIKKMADRYTMKDRVPSPVTENIQIASGCFMLIRGERLREVGGFDPEFFLYFEDFDLSLRLGQHGRVVQIPQSIVHFGGDASRKGRSHILMFVRSAFYFFRKHGFKVW